MDDLQSQIDQRQKDDERQLGAQIRQRLYTDFATSAIEGATSPQALSQSPAISQASPVEPDWRDKMPGLGLARRQQAREVTGEGGLVGAGSGAVAGVGDEDVKRHAQQMADDFERQLREQFPEVKEPGEAKEVFQKHVESQVRGKMLADAAQRQKGEDWGRYGVERTPLIGMAAGLARPLGLKLAYDRMKKGEATADDYELVGGQLADSQRESEKGNWRKAADIASGLPAFAAEWYLTGGAATAAKEAVAKQIGTSLLAKATAIGAAGAARTLVNVPRLAQGTLERMLPQLEEGKEGELQIGKGQGAIKSLGQTALSQTVSNSIFELGGPFARNAQTGLAKRFANAIGSIQGDMEAQKQLNRWGLGGSERGGVISELNSDDPKRRAAALPDFAVQLAVFGAFEYGMHRLDAPAREAYRKSLKDAVDGGKPLPSPIRPAGDDVSMRDAWASVVQQIEAANKAKESARSAGEVDRLRRERPEEAAELEKYLEPPAGKPGKITSDLDQTTEALGTGPAAKEIPVKTARQQADELTRQHAEVLAKLPGVVSGAVEQTEPFDHLSRDDVTAVAKQLGLSVTTAKGLREALKRSGSTPDAIARLSEATKGQPAPEKPAAAPESPVAPAAPQPANGLSEGQIEAPAQSQGLHDESHPATKAFLDTFGAAKTAGGVEGSPRRVVADLGEGPAALQVEISEGEPGSVRIDYGWKDPNRTGKQPGEFTRPLVRKLSELVGRLKDAGQGIEYTAVGGRDAPYARLLAKAGYEQVSGPTGEGNGLRTWKPEAEPKKLSAVERMRAKQAGLAEQAPKPAPLAQLEPPRIADAAQAAAPERVLLDRAAREAALRRGKAAQPDVPDRAAPVPEPGESRESWQDRVLQYRTERFQSVVKDALAEPAPEKVGDVANVVHRLRGMAEARGKDPATLIKEALPELHQAVGDEGVQELLALSKEVNDAVLSDAQRIGVSATSLRRIIDERLQGAPETVQVPHPGEGAAPDAEGDDQNTPAPAGGGPAGSDQLRDEVPPKTQARMKEIHASGNTWAWTNAKDDLRRNFPATGDQFIDSLGKQKITDRSGSGMTGYDAQHRRSEERFNADRQMQQELAEHRGAEPVKPPEVYPVGKEPWDFGSPLTAQERSGGLIGGGQEVQPGAEQRTNDPKKRLTALANAISDEELAKRGMPPLAQSERVPNKKLWAGALAALEEKPDAAAVLVDELAKAPRATTPEENALLLQRKIALANEQERAMRAAIKAFGTGAGTDKVEFDRLAALSDKLDGDMNRLADVIKKTGTQSGRALQFRKQLAAEDFTLSNMVLQMEAAKKAPLTVEEKAAVVAAHDKIEAAGKAVEVAAQAAEEAPRAKSGEEALAAPTTGELFKSSAAAQEAKDQFRREVAKAKKANQGWGEYLSDMLVKLRINMVISSPVTMAKIMAASLERVVIAPLESLAGAALARLPGLSKIAAAAPREGRGLNAGVEKRSFAEAFTQGFKDAWRTITTGSSELDTLYGTKQNVPREWLDYQFSLHDAAKAPAVRGEFTRSFLNRIDAALAKGEDATSPASLLRIGSEAYRDSQAAKFRQDNWLVDAYNRAVTGLRKPDAPVASRVAGLGLKLLTPVVRIPSNLAFEVGTHIFGTATGSVQAVRAWMRGVENLKGPEADAIMRQFKKGSLGAAALLFGYFQPQIFGGYYSGRRDEDDVKAGAARLAGADVPSWLMHNPLLEVFQFGATVRRAGDKVVKGEPQGNAAGTAQGLLGLAEEIPLVRETAEIGKGLSPNAGQRGAFFGELTKSLVIPQLVQWIAGQADKDVSGEPVKRKPQGVWQHIETGIPGLRGTVPDERGRKAEQKAGRASQPKRKPIMR